MHAANKENLELLYQYIIIHVHLEWSKLNRCLATLA